MSQILDFDNFFDISRNPGIHVLFGDWDHSNPAGPKGRTPQSLTKKATQSGTKATQAEIATELHLMAELGFTSLNLTLGAV